MTEDQILGTGLTCFIVSPIGNKLDPRGTDGRLRYEDNLQMWDQVLEPACEVFDLKAVRADRIADPGEITEQIFQYLRDADVVIADLSGANPNVMYELGLRHTRSKATIQIGEYGRLPFDVNTIRTIQFQRTEAGLIEARNSLTLAIRSALQGKGNELTATRVWNEGTPLDTAALARAVSESLEPAEESSDDDSELGIVDILAEGEMALEDATVTLTQTRQLIEQIGELTTLSSKKIAKSDAEGKGFAGRLVLAKSLASDLSDPGKQLEESANTYLELVGKLDAMVNLLCSLLEQETGSQEESIAYLKSIRDLSQVSDESAVQISGFIEQVIGIRKIAKDLIPPSRTIERSLNRYLKGNAVISSWRPVVEKSLTSLGVDSLASLDS